MKIYSSMYIVLLISLTLYAADSPKVNQTKIDAGKISLVINDTRTDIDTKEIVIPFAPFPGQNDAANSPMPKGMDKIYQDKINSMVGKSEKSVKCEIDVIRARKGWSVGTAVKKELISVELNISFIDESTQDVLVVGKSSSYISETKFNLSVESLNKEYENAFIDAFNKFINDDDNIRILNANLNRAPENTPETKQ